MSSSVALLDASNLFNIKGLVAVVTGGASGIGSMIARSLATNGASAVYILDLEHKIGNLGEAKEAVCKSGPENP